MERSPLDGQWRQRECDRLMLDPPEGELKASSVMVSPPPGKEAPRPPGCRRPADRPSFSTLRPLRLPRGAPLWQQVGAMGEHDSTRGILWVLRLGVVMEMFGHGALGIGRVAQWTAYFAVVGIHREAALTLMPLVGAFDVTLGLLTLWGSGRPAALYIVFWGAWTALLRPLAGESVWEAVERAGNYGAPLALFLFAGLQGASRPGGPGRDCEDPWGALRWVLRLTTVLLLLGHGMLGLVVRKPLLSFQYGAIGLHGAWVEPLVGGFECLLAGAVLLRPAPPLLFFVVAWKLATETLSPFSGTPLWVFVEHGGSYAAPLALAFLARAQPVRIPSVGAAAIGRSLAAPVNS